MNYGEAALVLAELKKSGGFNAMGYGPLIDGGTFVGTNIGVFVPVVNVTGKGFLSQFITGDAYNKSLYVKITRDGVVEYEGYKPSNTQRNALGFTDWNLLVGGDTSYLKSLAGFTVSINNTMVSYPYTSNGAFISMLGHPLLFDVSLKIEIAMNGNIPWSVFGGVL